MSLSTLPGYLKIIANKPRIPPNSSAVFKSKNCTNKKVLNKIRTFFTGHGLYFLLGLKPAFQYFSDLVGANQLMFANVHIPSRFHSINYFID